MAGAGVLYTSYRTVQLGDEVHAAGYCDGLYFGLQCSQGRALLTNALGLAGEAWFARDSEVCLYVCVEGDGAGRESNSARHGERWRGEPLNTSS